MTILSRNRVTTAGAELINSTIGGKNKITYTTAELYNKDISKLSDAQLAATTNIGTPIISGKCNVLNVSGTTVSIGSTIANGDLTADITFCTVGWFATTSVDQANGKSPVLIAISQLDAPTTLAHGGENGKATAYFLPKLNIGIANTTQIKLEPTEAGLVTVTELQQAMLELSNSGLIDLGNRLPNGMEVNRLHNTSLQYVPKGSVLGLPVLDDKKDEDKDNDDSDRGGYLMSLGNNELTQDGVQIYFNPYYNKTFVSFYNSKKNMWCDWAELGNQSYTKDEIAKILDNYATSAELNQKADSSNVYNKNQIDNEFDKVNSSMVTSVDNIKPESGNVSLDGKYTTPDDLEKANKNLLDFIKQLQVFNSDDMTTVENSAIDLESIKYKQAGIIKFNNCVLKVSKFQSELKLDDNNNIYQPNFLIEYGDSLSGWIINIPIEPLPDEADGNMVYQYIIATNDNGSTGMYTGNAKIYHRKVPVDKENFLYPLIDITADTINIANTAVSAAVGNAMRLKQFYNDRKIEGVVSTTYNTINLDNLSDLSKYAGIIRFDNCLLTTISIPPFDYGENSTQDLLYSHKNLSGWIIMLPTNSEKPNGLANFPLQIVICYKTDRSTSLDTEPEVVNNIEIYYRILNTSNKYDSSNYLRKFVNNSATTRIELTRQNFDFNNMIYSTEGETTLEKVMKSSNSNSYKKAKDVSLPLLFDLISDSKNVTNSTIEFEPNNIPFSYKIISERLTNASQNVIYVHQEIRCLGFIFYRDGSILLTSSGTTNRKFDDWILKGNYNPITEYKNPMGNGSGLNQQINAFVLPDGSDINFVGTTTYSDYKLTNASAPSIRFYPQGTYFLDGHRTYGGLPEENYNSYLVAMQTGATRLQFISYIKTGETTNYIRSGGPTAIGQWRLL